MEVYFALLEKVDFTRNREGLRLGVTRKKDEKKKKNLFWAIEHTAPRPDSGMHNWPKPKARLDLLRLRTW